MYGRGAGHQLGGLNLLLVDNSIRRGERGYAVAYASVEGKEKSKGPHSINT